MPVDPLEHAPLEENGSDSDDDINDACYMHIETSNAWTTRRDNLAREMFEQWWGSRYA